MFSPDVTQQSPAEVVKVLLVGIEGSDLEPSPLTSFLSRLYTLNQ